MKRRAFLVGLAAAPWFIRRAFGDASIGGGGGAAAGSGARTAATTRPTLVLVVPRDDSARWERGSAFGELLNHGGDRELAPLALVDVVCARAREFGISDDPLMLFVVGSTVHRLDAALPKDDAGRIRVLGQLVREVLPLEGKSARELAAAARERYVKKAPRGARWGRTTMCGNEYEEGPAEMVDCGMGHVPEVSRRFLDFYTGGKKS
ncbi:MAG: hypothetical protein ACXVCV_17160 [Polyangia bacterium]